MVRLTIREATQPGRWRAVAALSAALLLLLLVGSGTAQAHAVPVRSTPQANAILEEAPPQIEIIFNEPVVPNLSQIRVLTQAGQQVEVGEVRAVDAEETTLAVDFPPVENGTYLISWQVLSAVDGHTTSGTMPFGIGVSELTGVSEGASTQAQLSTLSAAARWLTLTALALLLGFFVFRLVIWRGIFQDVELEPEEAALDWAHLRQGSRIGLFAVALLGLGLLLVFIDQAKTYDLLQFGNFRIWLGTRFGTMWLARLGLGALLLERLLGLRLLASSDDSAQSSSRLLWTGLALAILLALTTALISHSAALTQDTLEALTLDLAHLLAASLWAGGLVSLFLALWLGRKLAPESRSWLFLSLILEFSTMAAYGIGILAASGTYLAWKHVGGWTTLVGTQYGLALLAKLALALVAVGIAGLNLFYVRPRLSKAYEDPQAVRSREHMALFRWLVAVEMGIALLILAAAGILTDLQRGVDAPLIADEAGSLALTSEADELMVELSLVPALVGQNTFLVQLTGPDGEPATDAEEVLLRFTFLEQGLGSSEAVAQPAGDGEYRLEGAYISLIGDWQVEVTIRRTNAFDSFAPFRLNAGLGGSIRPQGRGGQPLEQFASFMTLAGGFATGVGLVIFALAWGYISTRTTHSDKQLAPLLVISLVAFWIGINQLYTFFDTEFTPARFANNPILPDTESIAIGQELYETNCVACHGEAGRGDGPTAAALTTPPADFGSGHTASHPDGDLYYWILQGIDGTSMPAFEDEITQEQAWHLVNYVRRLSALASTSQANSE